MSNNGIPYPILGDNSNHKIYEGDQIQLYDREDFVGILYTDFFLGYDQGIQNGENFVPASAEIAKLWYYELGGRTCKYGDHDQSCTACNQGFYLDEESKTCVRS